MQVLRIENARLEYCKLQKELQKIKVQKSLVDIIIDIPREGEFNTGVFCDCLLLFYNNFELVNKIVIDISNVDSATQYALSNKISNLLLFLFVTRDKKPFKFEIKASVKVSQVEKLVLDNMGMDTLSPYLPLSKNTRDLFIKRIDGKRLVVLFSKLNNKKMKFGELYREVEINFSELKNKKIFIAVIAQTILQFNRCLSNYFNDIISLLKGNFFDELRYFDFYLLANCLLQKKELHLYATNQVRIGEIVASKDFVKQHSQAIYEIVDNVINHTGLGDGDGRGFVFLRIHEKNQLLINEYKNYCFDSFDDETRFLEMVICDNSQHGIIEHFEKKKKKRATLAKIFLRDKSIFNNIGLEMHQGMQAFLDNIVSHEAYFMLRTISTNVKKEYSRKCAISNLVDGQSCDEEYLENEISGSKYNIGSAKFS